jgi:hypothetical protein
VHQIQPYTTAVTMFTNDGQVRVFKSYSQALKELGIRWIQSNVGAQFCTFDGFKHRLQGERWAYIPAYTGAYAIMRNDLGDVVTARDFYALRKPNPFPWWRSRYDNWNGEGPVPGTAKRKAGKHYCRKLGTTQERRLAQSVDPDEPGPRPARSASNLPDSHDDYSVAARDDRSWKSFRRNQWKAQKQ